MSTGDRSELHHIPDADPIMATIGGVRPVLQILMQRLSSVEGVEAALAPLFDALSTGSAMRAFSDAGVDWALRPPLAGRCNSGLLRACLRLREMAYKAEGEPVGPLAQAPDPVDPTVRGDAAWCARGIACMIADRGQADDAGSRRDAADELNRYLDEGAADLHYDQDADAIAAVDRARERLEQWRETGE